MAPVEVINLLSDSESDEAGQDVAIAALASFRPRAQKTTPKARAGVDRGRLPTTAGSGTNERPPPLHTKKRDPSYYIERGVRPPSSTGHECSLKDLAIPAGANPPRAPPNGLPPVPRSSLSSHAHAIYGARGGAEWRVTDQHFSTYNQTHAPLPPPGTPELPWAEQLNRPRTSGASKQVARAAHSTERPLPCLSGHNPLTQALFETPRLAPPSERFARVEHYHTFHANEKLRHANLGVLKDKPVTTTPLATGASRDDHDEGRVLHAAHKATLSKPPMLAGPKISLAELLVLGKLSKQAAQPLQKRAAHSPSAVLDVPPPKRLRVDAPSEDLQPHGATASNQPCDDDVVRVATLQPAPEPPSATPKLHAPAAGGADILRVPVPSDQPITVAARPGWIPYTDEDDRLLAKLKEVEKFGWKEIYTYFPGRSPGALGVHYSTKVKKKFTAAALKDVVVQPRPEMAPTGRPSHVGASRAVAAQQVLPMPPQPPKLPGASRVLVAPGAGGQAAAKRVRGGGPSALEGFVAWADVRKEILEDPEPDADDESEISAQSESRLLSQDRAFPSSVAQVLRQRELGKSGTRGWAMPFERIPDELKNEVFSKYAPTRHYMSTCGDVTSLAWAGDGRRFAAGSIAITDNRSMQYNGNWNLLIGDSEQAVLQELPEHHISRPVVVDAGNINALHSMRESQDPRLFMTVAAVAFSPDGHSLYTAGSDRTMRVYEVGNDVTNASCKHTASHPAVVDILDVSRNNLIATACHTSEDGSVRVYHGNTFRRMQSLSPNRIDSPSTVPIFPSALKWGVTPNQSNYLLAGFSSDGIEEDRSTAGETALWDVETGQRIQLSTITRNVFDVAWNPSPSSASTAFCVASTPGSSKAHRGRRSVVQCYAPGQDRCRQVLEWDCPALDINDITYCPHDDNLTAAGATDGKVYVWDKRFASRDQKPLHVLAHGDSVNVLDHDRDRELADTGVRFLSWGATSSRLYSASSDGVVKAWNPYRAPDDVHVADVATFQAAIMSGSFNADHRELLIGEERGRINLLSIGGDAEDEAGRASQPFVLRVAKKQVDLAEQTPFAAARELVETRRIEIRPMGALPRSQAVQGPVYTGPFFRPSRGDWQAAQSAYQQALDKQNEVYSRTADPASESELHYADSGVEQARAALSALQSRADSFPALEQAAQATQRAFRTALQGRRTEQTGSCPLDCNYFSPTLDEGQVPDSLRSEQRIPGAWRALPSQALDVTALDCAELFEAGLAARCPHCTAHSQTALARAFCRQRRNGIRAGLTGVCEFCAAPVRRQESTATPQLCERCGFGCLRCSQPVQHLRRASDGGYSVYCETCELAWDVDVLGYNLVRDESKRAQLVTGSKPGKMIRLGDMDTEVHHYHSRWRSGQDQL
ncbi:hypothetical protein LTR53_006953 [Teratosphaeriaceae sp. CCFEE 6253]|nr:hypothetical protein LTR53_006953 [Teratosphaeriaceae sp. CCFEE 6253]